MSVVQVSKMRWNEPAIGAIRIISCFALFPIKAGHETRWLERVYVAQKYLRGPFGNSWINMNFTTKEMYNDRSEDNNEEK